MSTEPEPGEEFVTAQEAAAFLGVKDTAIRNAWHQGRLPFVERYGRKLIAMSDLVAYKERSQPEGRAKAGRPARQKVGGTNA